MLKTLTIIILSLLVTGLIARIILDHPCIKSHQEWVNHPMWIQYVITSTKPLMMVPIVHPEYTSYDTVCDKYK